ncbi:MAG TPA: Kdo hydroxylase family protein [Bryobacteraceae bacterium]|nr:Kdo hydroxylase family protein [Bryobacteraceae bacterium]
MPAILLAPGIDPYEVLETGNVLLLPEAPLELSAEDRDLIQSIRQGGHHHKNISYKPQLDKVTGLDKTPTVVRERLHAILRRYSEAAVAQAARILPRYEGSWRLDYASLRPLEESGRKLALKKRNDLLHVDAFPTRPTNGGLILRIFWNLHPAKPRVWWISAPFEKLAARYAMPSGIGRAARRSRLTSTLHRLGLPLPARSAYDEFMLAFHDALKGNAEFQSNCGKQRLEFAPNSAWMVFTDVVPHAVESGQFAMEQTLIVARETLASPDRAPISILEKLAGQPLA